MRRTPACRASASGASRPASMTARKTAAASVGAKTRRPPVITGAGCRSTSIAVTTPKAPPAPRDAQSSSGSSASRSQRWRPSAVRSSIARSEFDARPCARENQELPPPSVNAVAFTTTLDPDIATSPVPASASSTRPHFTPAPMRATRRPFVDLHHVEGRRAHEHGAVEVAGCPVPARLHGELQSVGACRGEHRPQFCQVGGCDDGRGMLVDREVPWHAHVVPAGVVRQHQALAEVGGERDERGVRGGVGHRRSSRGIRRRTSSTRITLATTSDDRNPRDSEPREGPPQRTRRTSWISSPRNGTCWSAPSAVKPLRA